MANVDDEENIVFNVEEVQKIVRDNIELCLGGNAYSHSRTPQWITIITEKTLSRLNKLNKPFKYIVRITITQRNGAGLHTAAAYFWDTATDATCTVRWENKYMYCIVNVFGCLIRRGSLLNPRFRKIRFQIFGVLEFDSRQILEQFDRALAEIVTYSSHRRQLLKRDKYSLR